ncbi:DNA phosphorothioation system sulfurtransferase DndC [Clostridium sp. A1-XYC3]|uniref:DNA phosphorothioation system sulfurtransferase DndC n=1 Tax=Clostridium tanneri TaxID=3037988 RepID=A0ABU4JTN5_9CLOT|nr:DNA phosphorothioation system sulfurtransferase DndC [Clostridium sp. A1-XYC3]MDW8801466.1 DNA phosphorothioation system sulfurtransferase DndC [Clostridium sp. A1-XYC3]
MNNNEEKLTLDEKVQLILDEMEMVYKNDKRPWVIGYSGGKDSTAVVQLAFMMLQRLPKDQINKDVYVVSSDTLIENPIMLGFLKMNSDSITKMGGEEHLNLRIKAQMVHPDYDNSFWANIIGKGLPTPTSIRFRWCTEKLKIKPSNKFIEEKVDENGEVIVLLGVRKAESIARRIRIENRQIDGYLLTPHATINNTYVYNPIVDLSTDEVWSILLRNNGVSPWGGNNNELFSLYMGSDGGECPFTVTSNKGEIDTPSCGNSRFGCWICTVVQKDKSLTGFIESGETWLQPLLNFKEWLLNIRNRHEYRAQYRRDGNHYYRKVYLDNIPVDERKNIIQESIYTDNDNKKFINFKYKDPNFPILSDSLYFDENGRFVDKEKFKLYLELLPLEPGLNKLDTNKILKDDKGEYVNVLGYGPFTFQARQIILRRLLELEKEMKEQEGIEFDLITKEELKAIDDIWEDEEDLSRNTLTKIYFDVYSEKLPWHDFKKPLLEEVAIDKINSICERKGISKDLLVKLLVETDKQKFYSNKSNLIKAIDKTLNQKHLYKDIYEAVEYDN